MKVIVKRPTNGTIPWDTAKLGPISYDLDLSNWNGPNIHYNSETTVEDLVLTCDTFSIPPTSMVRGKLHALDRTGDWFFTITPWENRVDAGKDLTIYVTGAGPNVAFHMTFEQ